MDKSTILGILASGVIVITAIALSPGAMFFVDLPAAMIVVGGVIGATLINFPAKDVLSVSKVLSKVFTSQAHSYNETIEKLVTLAERARREGILSIERGLDTIDDDFMKNGIQYAIDGTEPEYIRAIIEFELTSLENRHKKGQSIFLAMGTYSPAFGLIGTQIGLIQMLQTLTDPDQIGKGIATALVAAFYGILLAYALFLPIAGKLQTRSQEELQYKELVLEGILAIQSGDNPRIVREKLLTFVSRSNRPERRAGEVPGE